MKKYSYLFLLMILFNSCDKESEPDPRILFRPETLTLSTGQSGELSIKIEDFRVRIFGVTMRIMYDPHVVTFSDSAGFAMGNFFGDDIVSFIEEKDSVIHIALTLTQGQSEERGSGKLGALTFTGNSPGSSAIEIIPTELVFYDSDGDEVAIPELEIESSTISVQ
ncbi:MAG: hypothetical protein IIB45_11825 [Candidatus Marinimicrobia bacterium]|nr:hypothetical protein [Candidatus Neomarinimicrobiota bacterium]